jgi:hypothetical protein
MSILLEHCVLSARVDNNENSFRITFTIDRYYVFTVYYRIEYQYLMYRKSTLTSTRLGTTKTTQTSCDLVYMLDKGVRTLKFPVTVINYT